MTKEKNQNILSFYFYYFTTHLLPIYAVYILIVNDTLQSEVLTSVLIALWAFVAVVLEIPSGVLADYWNKKNVIIIGQIAKLLGCIIWMFSSSFLLYAMGFVLWGISESFCSGAIEALLYEELEHNDNVDQYQKISGRCRFLMTSGIVLGFISGSILKEINYPCIYYGSIFIATLTVLFTFFIPHYQNKDKKQIETSFYNTFFDAIKQICGKRLLLRILLYSIVYLSIIGSIEEFIQLWLTELNIKGFLFGGLLVIIMLSQMAGTWLCSVLIIKKRMELFLYAGMFLCGLLLIIGCCNDVFSITTMIFTFLITGIMETKLEAFAQEEITDQRSTIFSINSFVMNLTAIIIIVIIGLISETYSFKISFILLGSVIIIFSLYLILSYKCELNKEHRTTAST